ncbi:unnamed protein product [Trichobilharzia szidati]|nr:unnamed protein product [Trichobilharzia szidati]
MSSSSSPSSSNVKNTRELHSLNLCTLNSSETEPTDNLKRDSLIDNNFTQDEGVQPVQSKENNTDDELITNMMGEEKVENAECLMSDNDLLDMLEQMEQVTSNKKTESVRRSIDDITTTTTNNNSNSIILNFDIFSNVSQNRDSLELCESVDKLPQQSVDNNVVVTQEAESGQPVQSMENTADNEFIVNMNEEAEIENIECPMNDNHFLSMLDELEHMTTNEKAKSIRRSIVNNNNNNVNNNSIILNFDPFSNISSQSRDSLQLCESVDKSLRQSAVITPQSVDTDKSSVSSSSSRFNRTGHLISPLFCEDYVLAVNDTPPPPPPQTQVVSPLPMSNENNDVIETDPAATTSTKTGTSTPLPPPPPTTTTSNSSNAIQSFTEVTASTSTHNLSTSSFNVSSSSSSVMLNKSFTRYRQTVAASTTPLIYSPWRNRSVLSQALGGGGGDSSYSDRDSSPEWLSFSRLMNNDRNKPPPAQKGNVMIQQSGGGQLNYDDDDDDENEEKSFNAGGFLSHINKKPSNNDQCLLNTIQKKQRSAELDLLVGMLNRVEVKDDGDEKEEEGSKKFLVDEEQPSPPPQQQKHTENQLLRNPELTDNECVTPEIKVPKQITPSLTFDVVKPIGSGTCLQKKQRDMTVIGVPLQSPIYSKSLLITNTDVASISTPQYDKDSSRRRRSIERQEVLPLTSAITTTTTTTSSTNTMAQDDELNTTVNINSSNNNNNDNTSYTGGGISGFLAKAVRSVYSRLTSSSFALSQTSIIMEDNSLLSDCKHQHSTAADTSKSYAAKVNSTNTTSSLEEEEEDEVVEELAVNKNALNTTQNLIKESEEGILDEDEDDKHSVEMRKECGDQSRNLKSFASTSSPYTQSMSCEQQQQQRPLLHQQKFENVVSLEDEELWKTVSSVHDDNGDGDVDGYEDNSGDNKISMICSMEISNHKTSGIDNIVEGENKENMKVPQVTTTTTTAVEDIEDISMISEAESIKVTATPTSTTSESRQVLKEVSLNQKLGDTFDMSDGDSNAFAAATTTTNNNSNSNNNNNVSFSGSLYKHKEASIMNVSHTDNDNNNDDVELMKQNLREEISSLRNEADNLKSIMDEYKSAVIKAEEKLSETQVEDATKLIHLFLDGHETSNQAERMLSVHNDMRTRVERVQDAVKLSEKKQESLKKTLHRLTSDYSAVQTKINNFTTVYSKQLNDALIVNDRQKAEYQRKLDKLQCERRQAEMRILSLTQEVKQKDMLNDELKSIRDRILSSPVH